MRHAKNCVTLNGFFRVFFFFCTSFYVVFFIALVKRESKNFPFNFFFINEVKGSLNDSYSHASRFDTTLM